MHSTAQGRMAILTIQAQKIKHFLGVESVEKMIGQNEKKSFSVKIHHVTTVYIDPESLLIPMKKVHKIPTVQ